LEFSGIQPVRVHSFGPVRTADAALRQRWLERARRLGLGAQRI
ncbi:MAG: NAD(P)H-dependent oxidoreductase, partial [Pseudomonadota bacterium]|nr:NAD(P)H-dependent oxidoreductase [Pseudomonadota bacterium]